jgi:chemotaxis protein MotB
MIAERDEAQGTGLLGWVDVMATLTLILAVALMLVLIALGQDRQEAAVREETLGTLSGRLTTVERELHAARQDFEATQRTLVAARAAYATETTRLHRQLQTLTAQLQQARQDKALLAAQVAEMRRIPAQRFVLTNEQEDRIFFDTGKAVIKDAFTPILDRYVVLAQEYLAQDPRHLVQIEGHTDDVPCCRHTYRDNWELSTARATAVVQYFVAHDVDPARLVAVGHSQYKPRHPGTTESAWRQNRRIEIVFITRPLNGGNPYGHTDT